MHAKRVRWQVLKYDSIFCLSDGHSDIIGWINPDTANGQNCVSDDAVYERNTRRMVPSEPLASTMSSYSPLVVLWHVKSWTAVPFPS